ncbi:MAG: MmgE/PrpD family protein [Acidobacteria bacterium]|nr:MmgE/PrpD family protein [Acidobacteriota bacterium]
MTKAGQLADFVVNVSFTDISGFAVRELKSRVLDSLGCALGALGSEPILFVRQQIDDFGGHERCTLSRQLARNHSTRGSQRL